MMNKPGWLKTRPPTGAKFLLVKKALHEFGLTTVCQGAQCPNVGTCWTNGTATFMVMGSVCTRNCRFCAVEKGMYGEPLDPLEPSKIAQAVEKMGIRYAVLTSVDRDDLDDGGASHFAACISAIKNRDRTITVEALIPDFQGDAQSLENVVEAGPDVIGHNIETTEEFQALARDRRAGYDLSLGVLRNARCMSSSFIKSSLMLGLGEAEGMVRKTMEDLRDAGVDILTLGQYLRPTPKHLEVKEYLPPETFEYYKELAEDMGFLLVVSGPLVRSSYMADTAVARLSVKNKRM